MSSAGMNEWEPSRQPRDPPQAPDSKHTSFLQQHEGFIRFLKQHASPPHHRVTAGGRIVPTGPLSPPPMFDYASLNGLLEQPSRSNVPTGARINLHGQSSSGAAPASSQFKAQPGYPGFQENHQGLIPSIDPAIQYSPQLFMNPGAQSLPSSFALTPLGMFPDGTALISCNGICYRCFWSGLTTVMEPLTTGQPLLVPNQAALNDHSMSADKTSYPSDLYGNVNPLAPYHTAEPSFKGASGMPSSNTSQTLNTTVTASSTHSQESSLKVQLTSLDKYMALHHYEIGPSAKTQLVSRRKSLVEAIAKFRNDREPSVPTIPIVSSSVDLSRKSSAQSIAPRAVKEIHQQSRDGLLKRNSIADSSVKKCLSPSAPAFIPKAFANSDAASSLSPVPGHQKDSKSEMRVSSGAIKTSGNILDDLAKNEHRLRETSFSSEEKSLTEADPWDPAMKIVPPSMIAYAQKYNLSNSGVGKQFCTTTQEFQEAIRRVREQARMWGCVGGSSKDPAYDAEEDIWYAIKDEYPIPLPAATADHIICPRPWNWYDSAFNVNATVEPKINMSGHKLEENSAELRRVGSTKQPSTKASTAKSRTVGHGKYHDGFQSSKNSLKQSMKDGQWVPTRDSEPLFERRENEQRWHIQTSREGDDLRKQKIAANDEHKNIQSKYRHPFPQLKEVVPVGLSDAPKRQHQATQGRTSTVGEAVLPSRVALSAAQKVKSPAEVNLSHQCEVGSCLATPSSPPTETKHITSSKAMLAQMTPPSPDGDVSNGNNQHQSIVHASTPLCEASYKLTEQETYGRNILVAPEAKGPWRSPEQ